MIGTLDLSDDDHLGVGTLVQFEFEIIRRERFRDDLLRLGLTLGADAQALAFSLGPKSANASPSP